MDLGFISFLSIPIRIFLSLSINEKINVIFILMNLILGIVFLYRSILGDITIRTPKLRLLIMALTTVFLITEITSLQSIYLWNKELLSMYDWRVSGDLLAQSNTAASPRIFVNHIAYFYYRTSLHLRSISYFIFFISLHLLKGTYRKWQV